MWKGLLILISSLLVAPLSFAFGNMFGFHFHGIKGAPVVSAQSAVILDERTGKILWAKDAETPRYPASTTKIMTAMLLIENCKPDEAIVAPADIEKVSESSLHLKPGERVSAKDMLYALMLRSANDGAYAVARHVGGSVDGFADLMNQRAIQLGCTRTTFKNPHGLNSPDHKTTAHDLALIAREAMKYPEFRDAVKTYKYTVTRTINKGDSTLVSKNKWLKKDASADGIKTGYTRPAGKCYVGSATRNGYRVITVILKSDDWQSDHKAMLDWAFASHERTKLGSAGEVVGAAPIEGGQADKVEGALGTDVDAIMPKGKPAQTKSAVVFNAALRAPIARGQHIGVFRYVDASGYQQETPVVAIQDVPAVAPLFAAATSNSGKFMGGGILFGGWYLMRRRNRIRRRRLAYARLQKL